MNSNYSLEDLENAEGFPYICPYCKEDMNSFVENKDGDKLISFASCKSCNKNFGIVQIDKGGPDGKEFYGFINNDGSSIEHPRSDWDLCPYTY